MQVVLSGSGYFFPEHEISNEELEVLKLREKKLNKKFDFKRGSK